MLKDDVVSRVERIAGSEGSSRVRKTYRPAPFFLWRTFLARAKARREFDNLHALRRRGVAAVEPLGWTEERRCGCVPVSSIDLEDVGDVPDLRAAFAADQGQRLRRALLVAFGRLLGSLHDAGFVSLTFYPRNVLVVTPAPPELRLCDQPYLLRYGVPVRGRFAAGLDVYDALFTPGRVRALARTARWRVLRAYCNDDRSAAADLWRRSCRRPLWLHRLCKGWLKIVCRMVPGRRPRSADR